MALIISTTAIETRMKLAVKTKEQKTINKASFCSLLLRSSRASESWSWRLMVLSLSTLQRDKAGLI
jgi:hypothetical protein